MQNRLTQKAQNALTRALSAAEELGHTYVGTEHLLIGLAGNDISLCDMIYAATPRMIYRAPHGMIYCACGAI